MKKIYILLVLMVTMTLVGCGNNKRTLEQIIDKGVLRIAINAEFPPFEYKEGGEYKGFDIELIKAYGKHIGVEVRFEHFDFDAALLSASSGKSDLVISAVTANDIRRESMSFSSGYYSASQIVVVKNDSPIDGTSIAEVENALTDKKIGVQRGTTAQYYVEGSEDWDFPGILGAKCSKYDSGSQAIADLKNGNIDAVIIDAAPAYSFVENASDLRCIEVMLTEEEYAIGTWLGNDSLVNSLNEFLSMYINSNEYQQLLDKYFGKDE